MVLLDQSQSAQKSNLNQIQLLVTEGEHLLNLLLNNDQHLPGAVLVAVT